MPPRTDLSPPAVAPALAGAGAHAVLLALPVAVMLALALAGCSGSSSVSSSPNAAPSVAARATSGFDGAALPAGARPGDFTLADQSGRRVSLRSYRGKVVVLAFVYSSCGPTCILLAQQIRGALDALPAPVPVIFVSADPAADTPARIGRFLALVSLAGRAQYLTGPRRALEPVWRAYGAVTASSGRAAFDRSATVILIDRGGRERVVFGLEQLTPEGLSHDIAKLSHGD